MGAGNDDIFPAEQAADRRRHGHAVITDGVNGAAGERAAAFDDQAVRQLRDLAAKGIQQIGGSGEPV